MNTNTAKELIDKGFVETSPLVWVYSSSEGKIVADFRSQRPQWYGDKDTFPWYPWLNLEIKATLVSDWREVIPEPDTLNAGVIEE